MLDWPDDTLVEQLPAPAFTADIIFSLTFLMVHNVFLGRLTLLRRMDVIDVHKIRLSYDERMSIAIFFFFF